MAEVIRLAPSLPRNQASAIPDPDNTPVRTDTVYVLSTSSEDTLAAVRVARDLASALRANLTLVHIRTVPFILAVDDPTAVSQGPMTELRSRLEAEGVPAQLRTYVCRTDAQAFDAAFKPHSLIVMAGPNHWWPRRSARRRKALETAGHRVVFIETSTVPGHPDDDAHANGTADQEKEEIHA